MEELDRVEASEQLDKDGLITAAQLSLYPARLELMVEPLAFGPLRFEGDDPAARRSSPEAMCRISCEDGRTGLAWMEWNLNQSGE